MCVCAGAGGGACGGDALPHAELAGVGAQSGRAERAKAAQTRLRAHPPAG